MPETKYFQEYHNEQFDSLYPPPIMLQKSLTEPFHLMLLIAGANYI